MKKRKKQKKRKIRKGKKQVKSDKQMTGVYSRAKGGFGFVMDPERKRPDVFVPVGSTEGAMSGDIVTVAIGRNTGKGPRGRIIKILEKRTEGFLATVREYGGNLYAVPDDPSAGEEIFISNQDSASVEHRVLIELDRESLDSGMAKGKVLEDFGHCDDPAVDLPSILRLYGFTFEYPEKAESEAEAASAKSIDLENRKDLRDLYTCTIDPASAKDFDDAISVTEMENEWEVWVHIADVAHYVKGGGALDKEALRRSTSVYLLNRVIPMLPECLSNNACSLVQGEDKAAKSIRMVVDRSGNITEYKVYRTVINSNRRFKYEDVQDIIEGTSQDSDKEHVLRMHKVSSLLRKKRFKGGSINLEIPEMFPLLNSSGEVLELQMKIQKESNQLVEDMMLAANKCVANLMHKKKLSGPFRVHGEPDPLKKKDLMRYLTHFGVVLQPDFSRKELSEIIRQFSGEKDSYIVNLAILRSFKQAEYAASNEGHFALAFKDYLHFTSPIRRYPDLAVHRTLDRVLFGLDTGNGPENENTKIKAEMVRSTNEKERRAMKAESTLSMTKILRYIKKLPEGTLFEGVVSRVEEEYLAVELIDYLVYGRLYLNGIEGDFRFGRNGLLFSGTGKPRHIGIGSRIQVLCSGIDPFKRSIELKLGEEKVGK